MLKLLSIILILFFSVASNAQDAAPGIDLDLNSFLADGNGLYWPYIPGPAPGDRVAVASIPHPPYLSASTIKVDLQTSDSVFSYVSVDDWKDPFMTVWFSVSVPAFIPDGMGGNANDGAFVMCNTSDGQAATIFNGDSWELGVEATPSHPGPADLSCIMGHGTNATITITEIRIEIKDELPALKCDINAGGPGSGASDDVSTNTASQGEDISLTGAGFSLKYSSNWTKSYGRNLAGDLGLGGWLPGSVRRYSKSNHILINSNGSEQSAQPTEISPGVYSFLSSDGSESYIFNENGQHLKTVDNELGLASFTFGYQMDGKLASITDKFGKSTTFNYSESTVTITGPYGQTTTLNLDANGFLASVKNPNNETYHLTNDANGLLLGLQKPMGQQSHATYDDTGHLLSNTGAGGDSVSLVRTFDDSNSSQNLHNTSSMGRLTIYQTTASNSSSSQRQIIRPYGGTDSYSNNDIGLNENTDQYGNHTQFTTSPDPRFGLNTPYVSSFDRTVPNSNIHIQTTWQKTASAVDSAHPYILASETKTLVQQNDPTRTFTESFNGSTKTRTKTTPEGRTSYTVLNNLGLVSTIQNAGLTPTTYGYDSDGRLVSTVQGASEVTPIFQPVGARLFQRC